ncbi:FG-GAP-like repeat-containing protein [Cohnella soli]|uniref:FG-GAP-like repeat-containing protein n=1 Tax=Cohnella soli TaxID=425005 RepID=A0ABW0HTX1_9BACL
MRRLVIALCIVMLALSSSVVHADGADGRPTVGLWYSSWYAKKPNVASTWATGFGIGSTNQFLGDVNGDGKADAVVFVASSGTWYVELSNGNGFDYFSTWRTGHGTGSSEQFLADANGDGKLDAIAYTGSTGAWSVALSNGTGFNAPSTWISGHGIGSAKQFMADVNGDGKADAIVFFSSAGSWYASTSTGSSFNAYTQWANGHGVGSSNQLMGDVNADGKADAIVFFNAAGSWYSALSSGTVFQSYTQWANGFAANSQNQLAEDANGDGYADMFAFYNSDRNSDGKSGDWYGRTYSRDFPGTWNGELIMNSGLGYGATKTFQANVTGDPYGWKASVAFIESTGTWKVEPYRYAKLNLHNSWDAWGIKYVPYTLGSYQTYDSNNTAVIDEHLQNFADAKIDFLLFDATNGLYADDAYIYERQQTAASRIRNWNSNPSNRKVKYALAVGVVQFTHTPKSVEFEAGEVWDRFVNTVNGGTNNFYYENGKPLLVLYCSNADHVAWENWTGDKTNSNKFTVRYAEGPASAGYYGWFTPASGAILDDHAMNVMPGVDNHYPGFTPISRENGDYYSKKSWDKVMTKNPRPEVVVISSYNEYREDNPIAATDTSNVTGTTEKWYNKNGVIDNFMYWNMTKEYIRRLENRAFGVSRSASSSGESSDWGLSRLNDGQLNTVTGSSGYTSQNSLTTNHTEYVKLDLGASKTVSKVDLYPRNDGVNTGYGFPVDFTIQISTDNVNWTTVVTRTGYAKPSDAVQSFSFTAASARYVKLEATSLRSNPNDSNSYRLQLNEFEIY